MNRRGPTSSPAWTYVATAIATIAVMGLVVVAFRHTSGSVPDAGSTPGYSAQDLSASPSATTSAVTLRPLASKSVLILGDSWTQGYGADDPNTQGWAPLVAKDLGWTASIHDYSGVGYVKSASAGNFAALWAATTFPATLKPALVVLQGSVNDQGEPPELVQSDFTAAVRVVRTKFPSAQIIAVGPLAQLAAEQPRTLTLADTIAQVAAALGVVYINPMDPAPWFTVEQLPLLINASKLNHPNAAGYRLFANDFESAYQGLAS